MFKDPLERVVVHIIGTTHEGRSQPLTSIIVTIYWGWGYRLIEPRSFESSTTDTLKFIRLSVLTPFCRRSSRY